MDMEPVLGELVGNGCRFVVVGSVARRLMGEGVAANDLDIVVDDSPPNRETVVNALVALGAWVERRWGRGPLHPAVMLSWDWGWRVTTSHGSVDIITRFIDGSDYRHHRARSAPATMADGAVIRCHPTRHRP